MSVPGEIEISIAEIEKNDETKNPCSPFLNDQQQEFRLKKYKLLSGKNATINITRIWCCCEVHRKNEEENNILWNHFFSEWKLGNLVEFNEQIKRTNFGHIQWSF